MIYTRYTHGIQVVYVACLSARLGHTVFCGAVDDLFRDRANVE